MSVCPSCLTVYPEYDTLPENSVVRCIKEDKTFFNNPHATVEQVEADNKANEDKVGFIICPTCGQSYKPGAHKA